MCGAYTFHEIFKPKDRGLTYREFKRWTIKDDTLFYKESAVARKVYQFDTLEIIDTTKIKELDNLVRSIK
jgi:hypothetical protein